jgi:hypothetical protein
MEACSGSDALPAMLSRPTRSSPRRGEEIDRLLGILLHSHQEHTALTRHLESRTRDCEDDVKIIRKLLGSGGERAPHDAGRGRGELAEHYEDERK